eukprot:m.64708 g.64708  ORF g.64708 m.64708 type:complete len:61 (-) comp8122_c0_seq9:362-544(-)
MFRNRTDDFVNTYNPINDIEGLSAMEMNEVPLQCNTFTTLCSKAWCSSLVKSCKLVYLCL